MAITTGNEANLRPILRVASTDDDSDGANILYITDLTFSGDNNLATYNTIDSLSTLKFATTSDRSISISFLRDDAVQANLDAYFNDKTEIDFELSPLGTGSGQPFKSGVGFITNLSENKTGTNIWEITATIDINGDLTLGTHS